MTTALEPELSTYRWSSHDEAHRFPVEDPATGEVITIVQGAGAAEVNAAVQAARRAFQTDWRWRTPAERAALLLQAADVLDEHADELALLESRERKPGRRCAPERHQLPDRRLPLLRQPRRQAADRLLRQGRDLHLDIPGAGRRRRRDHPVQLAADPRGRQDGPRLAAGNTVVLKPSEQAPLTVMRIVELLNTVLPGDVLHAVPGSGHGVGQPLAGHPLVRMVSFTGSTGAGAAVAGTAAKNITPAVLELGGKDALIVFSDADVDRAVKDTLEGAFSNKGEACTASSRILVQDGLYGAFVEQLAAAAAKLKVGRGTDLSVHVGPVVTKTQQERVLSYIQVGIDEGARIAAQAALPAEPELANGFWVAPTVFADVTRDMRIAREEMFGPVVTVTRFSDEDEAVAITNESEYGLTSVVYTADSARAFRVARRIDAGMVFINNYFRGVLGSPFGGTKHSGHGREHAIETLREFSYTKMVRFPSGLGTIPAWRAIGDIFEPAA
jgi:acyl-CoA reductase-like NAD-dependent aldehyde dehydrogenase